MSKVWHEFRDPIHSFITADQDERLVIDSPQVQRLRHIHQLAMTYLIYPGATHRRFEHSLGVMELAGRVFDILTRRDHLNSVSNEIRDWLLDETTKANRRRALRIAALCHDVGHLPFSHAAESALLPSGWDHERLTHEHLHSADMMNLWESDLDSAIRPNEISKYALGPKNFPGKMTVRETLLSEIITGDAFGVDRMDYLLRDSHHTGVAYGRFDHFRLIDTLRILPAPYIDNDMVNNESELRLGIELGGLQSAEALLMARYFMYSQVYFHRARRIYDIHLKDFLTEYLGALTPQPTFPTEPIEHLKWTDAEITSALLASARDSHAPGHDSARRIVQREPFKLLWERNPSDLAENPAAGKLIADAATTEFGDRVVRHDVYSPKSPVVDFPVLLRNGSTVSARSMSEVLSRLPVAAFEFVFIDPQVKAKADKWLSDSRSEILSRIPGE